jgi:hypothetical protein
LGAARSTSSGSTGGSSTTPPHSTTHEPGGSRTRRLTAAVSHDFARRYAAVPVCNCTASPPSRGRALDLCTGRPTGRTRPRRARGPTSITGSQESSGRSLWATSVRAQSTASRAACGGPSSAASERRRQRPGVCASVASTVTYRPLASAAGMLRGAAPRYAPADLHKPARAEERRRVVHDHARPCIWVVAFSSRASNALNMTMRRSQTTELGRLGPMDLGFAVRAGWPSWTPRRALVARRRHEALLPWYLPKRAVSPACAGDAAPGTSAAPPGRARGRGR